MGWLERSRDSKSPSNARVYAEVVLGRLHDLEEQYQALQLAATRQLTPLDVAATHIDILRHNSEGYDAKGRDNVALIVEQHVNEARKALFDAISNPASGAGASQGATDQALPGDSSPAINPEASEPEGIVHSAPQAARGDESGSSGSEASDPASSLDVSERDAAAGRLPDSRPETSDRVWPDIEEG